MMTRVFAACTGLLLAAVYLNGLPASALTMKECGEKYKAAKAAGNTAKWNDFRKAECGSDASATPAAAPTTPATTEAKPAAEPKMKKKAVKAESPAPSASPAGPAVFPTAVSDKYSKETPGKARMHTCLDQYNTNKASNANGGMNWIQKGGGYYSECNKRLKGA